MKREKVILVTNDDGIEAPGLEALVESVIGLGKIVVVAPDEPRSGMSHAITVKHPLRIKKFKTVHEIEYFSVNGTPVDCVKMAMNQVIKSRPDLVVSGINHGRNASTSVLYSGTMGAALEGSVNLVPSIGFSYSSFAHDIDFSVARKFTNKIVKKVMSNGLPKNICLNVNFPNVDESEIKGIKICRQNMGFWEEEYDKRTDPGGRDYFWLTGKYFNSEPEATDTDEWALKNNYVSIVPTSTDLTCYKTLNIINQWDL
ncbi:MAG: 5'/3'-nucleotidase SurE [Bacteroidales bacterium]|nr:5'/3'-nucleotidase SurE [Bacteroidales bacterium]